MSATDAGEPGIEYIPGPFKPPSLLPIARHRESLLYLVEHCPVVIVVGQTGSGKTTQIPQFLDQAGWCRDGRSIAVTQPRRVAATAVAARVAEEMRCQLGQDVGYSIRFEDVTSAATRIKFLTDGLLLREALVDPLLSRYSVIMVDEAHERSLSSDVLLGLLKKIAKRRPELRIIVSSATLQAEEFLRFFVGDQVAAPEDKSELDTVARIVSLEGRTYPVDIQYLEEPTGDYVNAAVETVLKIHKTEAEGDVLVFLTGRDEIEKCLELIGDEVSKLPSSLRTIQPIPMYAGLPSDQQMYVFEPAGEGLRKVVLSTNIAEASITIEGIGYVVDCGYVKLRAFNPINGIETLTATPVSRASATQRAGRAGRTKPGKCFRLYPEAAFDVLQDATVAEMQRSNLAPLILQLKALGIDNVARFDYLTPPPAELMARGLEFLYALGALDDYARLTKPLGIHMAELAVEPMMAKVLLSAAKFGCLSEILTVAAMTSLQDGSIWIEHTKDKKSFNTSRHKFAAQEGDHLTLLNVYQAFVTKGRKDVKWCRENNLNFKSLNRALSIRNQLRRYLEKFGIDTSESLLAATKSAQKGEQICRCLTTGYFAHAARMQDDGSFETVNGMTVWAHPSSLMFHRKAEWVIFGEVMETRSKTFIKDVTKIERKWLEEYGAGFYRVREPSTAKESN